MFTEDGRVFKPKLTAAGVGEGNAVTLLVSTAAFNTGANRGTSGLGRSKPDDNVGADCENYVQEKI